MDMEERSYPLLGGVRVQQLTEIELDDLEHPQFVNSSISDDEDLGENNNLSSSSYCVPNPRKIFPIPMSSVVVPPKLPAPPAATSSSCFVANVLRSVQENNNNAKNTQGDATVSLQSLQKLLCKTTFDGQREVLEKFQRRSEKRSELINLKESLNKLQTQKKALGEEYTGLVNKCANRSSSLKQKLAQNQNVYKKGEDRLKDKTKAKDKLQDQLKHVKRKLEEVSKEDAELNKWTLEHGIFVHMKPKNSSSCSEKDEVVIELQNVNPLKPEDRFHVLAESVTLNQFCIGNVFPEFEEAFDVIDRANESQDLIQLLRDCMKYWKRDCAKSFCSRHSDKLSESTKVQTMIVDQSVELFDSPPMSNK